MSLSALAWRGLQALVAVIAALGSMGCFLFAFLDALGGQVVVAEGRQAPAIIGQLFFGFALAGLSSWLVWRILPPRGRVAFGALLILAAVGSRPLGAVFSDPNASDTGFLVLLAGAYAFVGLVMFVLVELGHRMLVAMAETRAERAKP